MSGTHPQPSTPIDVVSRFYDAENAYMNAGGTRGGADFAAMAATLDPAVVLHQTPDLPWGGEFHGHAGYEDWARQMSDAFDRLDVRHARFLTEGDTVVILCRLVTRSRKTGEQLDLPMAQMVRVSGDKIVEFRPFYWNVPAYQAAVQRSAAHEWSPDGGPRIPSGLAAAWPPSPASRATTPHQDADMATMYVTYPGDASTRFDRDYYVHHHLPLVMEAWGPYGLESAAAFFPPGDGAGTIAVCICRFRDDAAPRAAVGSPRSGPVMADVAKFTDATPAQSLATPL